MTIEIRNLREGRKQLDTATKGAAPMLRLGSIDDADLAKTIATAPETVEPKIVARTKLWPRRVLIDAKEWASLLKAHGTTLRRWAEIGEIEVLGEPGTNPLALAA